MNEKIMTAYSCTHDMKRSAKVWSMVKAISAALNESEVSYGEFCEIVSLIDHFTHHQAEIDSNRDWLEYKMSDENDGSLTEANFVYDIDDEDDWFVIPEI